MIGVFALLALAAQVAAHGYVPQVQIGNNWYTGWNVPTDPYQNPAPLRPVRRTPNDSGYIADPKSSDITCSIGNRYLPAGSTLTVAAGDSVKVHWNTWPDGHYGLSSIIWPSVKEAVLASVGTVALLGSRSLFLLVANNFTWPVTIPSKLAAGDYLLRHEQIALHGATSVGGAQFYPVCIQLTVTGGGSVQPSGNLAFPGAYSANDPGILFKYGTILSPYQGDAANAAYKAPGGSVYQF
ncbi:glycoside hydrolase [Serendipita vermifera]|nr:glycoside hydrolase [Serendipita vermifera]